jgi:hypothetical protein
MNRRSGRRARTGPPMCQRVQGARWLTIPGIVGTVFRRCAIDILG